MPQVVTETTASAVATVMSDTPIDAAVDRSIQAAIGRATRLLRARGERMTEPRRAVLWALGHHRGHLSADQVVTAVADAHPSVHRASVYRTLERLTDLGVVQRVHLGHGTTAYHLVGDPHPHAQCRACGVVLDLPDDLLEDVRRQLDQLHGFALEPTGVALAGICSRCRVADLAAR
ncbi:MAG: Fur family transcriptional regulator [Angustibacter sp.]